MEKTTGLDDDETDGSDSSNAESDPPQEDKKESIQKCVHRQGTETQKKPPAVSRRRRVVNQRDKKARQRELNRLSKARCRKRRNETIKKLENDNARLSAEYNELQAENEQLRQEFGELCHSPEQASSVGPVHQGGGLATRPPNNNWSAAPASLDGQGTFNNAAHWTGTSLEYLLANPTHHHVVNNLWSSNTATAAYLLDHQQPQQAFAMEHMLHHHQPLPQGGFTGNMPPQWPVAAYRSTEPQQDTVTSKAYLQKIEAAIATRVSQFEQEHTPTSKPKRKYSDES